MKLSLLLDKIKLRNHADVKLLTDPDVLRWLFGITSFLPQDEKTVTKKTKQTNLKNAEDDWGWKKCNEIQKKESKTNWTTVFGQRIGMELYMLLGKEVWKPKKKENKEPDLETDAHVVEVKTQTYFTTGTAGEKICGVPYKYASVPRLFNKPLHVLCIGGAEKKCKEEYRLIPCGGKYRPSEEQIEMIDLWKNNFNISYISATDLLQEFYLMD